jgi:CBS domain containing-hemolysin-like protein
MEEIVGDISDEFDEEDLSYSKLDENTFIFEAKISLKDFFRIIKLEEIEIFDTIKGDSETLAGMLLEITKKFPKQGQKIEFEKYFFTVMELGQFRIKRVKVKLPDKTNKND